MAERTNQEWLADLRGPEQDQVLADLRSLLLRGLRYALANYSVSEIDQEDLAQEALLRIMAGLDSFRGESRFTTWAHKIAVHVAFGELRRRRWKEVSLQDLVARYESDFTPAVLTDTAPSPEHQTARQMVSATLQRFITEELTERQRKAMMAVMMGGMPLEEVAHRMGSNRNALYKLLHDARQRLKKRMLAQGLSAQDMLAAFD